MSKQHSGGKRSTLALGVAALALVSSTAGIAHAAVAPKNSVTSVSIKNGSVAAADLGRIVMVKKTSGEITDADGTTNGGQYETVNVSVACPKGSKVISGGAVWLPAEVGNDNHRENVYLQSTSKTTNGWNARGIVDFGAQGAVKLEVRAYCLK